jgi:hypothetical protein
MNTVAHTVLNLLCLGRRDEAKVITPIVVGSILPDAPMFWFYFVEKVIRGQSERMIWGQLYFQPQWQNFFDLFNSLPLMAIGFALAAWQRSRIGLLLFGSMMLHVLGDLPLHNDDAHRHFFPFSHWRLISPVSYWDPDHYGGLVSSLEALGVLISCGILLRVYRSSPGKWSIGLIGGCYLAYVIYAFAVWF